MTCRSREISISITRKGSAATPLRAALKDATVKDEGRTYNGIDSIKQWKAEASTKYTYTSEPFALEQKGGMTVVTSRLTGNFPGSPINLRFFFRLERGKVAFLEIIP